MGKKKLTANNIVNFTAFVAGVPEDIDQVFAVGADMVAYSAGERGSELVQRVQAAAASNTAYADKLTEMEALSQEWDRGMGARLQTKLRALRNPVGPEPGPETVLQDLWNALKETLLPRVPLVDRVTPEDRLEQTKWNIDLNITTDDDADKSLYCYLYAKDTKFQERTVQVTFTSQSQPGWQWSQDIAFSKHGLTPGYQAQAMFEISLPVREQWPDDARLQEPILVAVNRQEDTDDDGK